MSAASPPAMRFARSRTLAAFVRHDATEELSYPMAVVFHQLSRVLPLFIYFFVAHLVVDGSSVGRDYFTFAAIGLAITVMLQQTLSGFGSALQFAQDRGTFETLLVEPVSWILLPFAMNTWRTIGGYISGLIILSSGIALGAELNWKGTLAFLIVLLLGTFASAAVGILAASMMVLAKRSAPLLTLYGLAASLVSGAFFPVEQLPAALRALSLVMPHTYTIDAARKLLMVHPPDGGWPVLVSMAALIACSVVTLAVGLPLFRAALQYARRMGLLSGY